MRSQVVVRKAGGSDDDSEEESDGWSLDIDSKFFFKLRLLPTTTTIRTKIIVGLRLLKFQTFSTPTVFILCPILLIFRKLNLVHLDLKSVPFSTPNGQLIYTRSTQYL